MTTIGSDSFSRSNVASPSWGTATGGGSWTRPFGSATTYSVTSNEGVIASTPSTWDHFVLGPTFTYTSAMEVTVRFICDSVTNTNAGVLLRTTSAGTTNYKVIYDGIDGLGLTLYYDSPGTGLIQLGTNSAFTPVVGTAYWVKGLISGSTLSGKIWKDGNSEPAYMISASTTAHSITSGGFGILGAASSNLKFDHFTATDGTSVTNQTVTYINTVASSETQSNAIVAFPSGTTAIVDAPVIHQSATMSNTTVITELINAGTFQQVVNNNTTATAESVSIAQRIIATEITASIEAMLLAQRASMSNTTVVLDTSTATSQPATSSTDPNSQMLYDDLQIQYQRIRGSTTNSHIAVLALVYYPPAQVLSEHAVPGELDVQLSSTGAWSQLRTINDVTAFIAANP